MLRPARAVIAVFALSALGCRAPRDVGAAAIADADIAAVLVEASTAEILYAELALAKSADGAVQAFARMMRNDHGAVNAATAALAARLQLVPGDNTLAVDLRENAAAMRLTLRDFEGFAFDSAYAANEVAHHGSVLAAIDESLIPAARHPEVRALLVQVRLAIAAHLGHAKDLAAKKSSR